MQAQSVAFELSELKHNSATMSNYLGRCAVHIEIGKDEKQDERDKW